MAIALYARKSIEKDGSISCETQLEYCKAMIKPNERSQETLTFTDNGFSGGNMQRDAFKSMLCGIERGYIKKVIVYRLDRISRSLYDFVNILNTFKKYGVDFVSSQEAFDTSSPYGELIVKILAVFAEFERNSSIMRVKQAYSHRSKLGLYMGGKAPFGYTYGDTVICGVKTKKLTCEYPNAQIVKQMYFDFDTRLFTLSLLSQSLKESGYSFSPSRLSEILKNPVYVRANIGVYNYFSQKNAVIQSPPQAFDGVHGLMLYGKTKHDTSLCDMSDISVVAMSHEGIVDGDVWVRCQKRLENNTKRKKALSNKSSWLSGVVKCKECGGTLTTVKGKTIEDGERVYFICPNKSKGVCEGISRTLYAKSIEQAAEACICECFSENDKSGINEKNACKLEKLKGKISFLEAQKGIALEKALDGHTDGVLLQMLNQRVQGLQKKIDVMQGKADALLEKSGGENNGEALKKAFVSAEKGVKRQVAMILVEKIYVLPDASLEIQWNV